MHAHAFLSETRGKQGCVSLKHWKVSVCMYSYLARSTFVHPGKLDAHCKTQQQNFGYGDCGKCSGTSKNVNCCGDKLSIPVCWRLSNRRRERWVRQGDSHYVFFKHFYNGLMPCLTWFTFSLFCYFIKKYQIWVRATYHFIDFTCMTATFSRYSMFYWSIITEIN